MGACCAKKDASTPGTTLGEINISSETDGKTGNSVSKPTTRYERDPTTNISQNTPPGNMNMVAHFYLLNRKEINTTCKKKYFTMQVYYVLVDCNIHVTCLSRYMYR